MSKVVILGAGQKGIQYVESVVKLNEGSDYSVDSLVLTGRDTSSFSGIQDRLSRPDERVTGGSYQARLEQSGIKYELRTVGGANQFDVVSDGDLFIVATSTALHLPYAQRALESSLGKVFCEKPLVEGSGLDDALKFLESFPVETYGDRFAINHPMGTVGGEAVRNNSDLRDALRSGKDISIDWTVGRKRNISIVDDLLPHPASLIPGLSLANAQVDPVSDAEAVVRFRGSYEENTMDVTIHLKYPEQDNQFFCGFRVGDNHYAISWSGPENQVSAINADDYSEAIQNGYSGVKEREKVVSKTSDPQYQGLLSLVQATSKRKPINNLSSAIEGARVLSYVAKSTVQ